MRVEHVRTGIKLPVRNLPSKALQCARTFEVTEFAAGEAETPEVAPTAAHSELASLVSSLQQQVEDAAEARALQVPQQRMPSLFGSPPVGPLVRGATTALPHPPSRLAEPALGVQQLHPYVERPSCDLSRLLARGQGADGDSMAPSGIGKDIRGNTLKCFAYWQTKVEQFFNASTPCVDDYQFKDVESKTVKEL